PASPCATPRSWPGMPTPERPSTTTEPAATSTATASTSSPPTSPAYRQPTPSVPPRMGYRGVVRAVNDAPVVLARRAKVRDITTLPNCGRYPLAHGAAAHADCHFASTPAKVTIRSRWRLVP